jgi:UDP-N-acetylmuramoyl-L-alanyl-D-glutamate--2,6-diaminopimelate ligase
MTWLRVNQAEILTWLQAAGTAAHLHSDSRSIDAQHDAVFFAYPGDEADGRNFIGAAIKNGAKAVVFDATAFAWNENWKVPHLGVPGLKTLAGPIAAAWYGQPDTGMFTAAVTGTNGKTSCSQWIGSALSRLGERTAVIGTLGISSFDGGLSGEPESTGYTTPDAVMLQRLLAQLRKQGATSLAIEASSIGLAQDRLNGMHFDVALFTNFTRDHLDYHGDMASYAAAKKKLFDWPGLAHAVLNLDDELGRELAETHRGRMNLIGYSLEGSLSAGVPVLLACDIRHRSFGMEFRIESPFGSARMKSHLVGHFNVSNLLGVLGVLLAKGVEWDAAVAALKHLEPAPGRMQQMGGRDAPLVVIDYAHTPDALEKALEALRQIADERNGQLWCVFGCGGDRDSGKRPQMGHVAEAADHVIVTSDNPRGESPQEIIEQIVGGMSAEHQKIEDRASAILLAVKQAAKNDVILLAGKGHEAWQEVMGVKFPFIDAEHVALALAARATVKRAEE